MKISKKIILLSTSLIALFSCGGSNGGNNMDNNKNNTRPTDKQLAKVDDIYSYDNFIKMEGNNESPDPFVMRFNGKYYMYPTTGGGYVKCYVSSDMYNWEPCDNGVDNRGYCYSYSNDGAMAPKNNTPFAPEVIYYNGYFYMIISPSGNGHYILQSSSPIGPFSAITGNINRSIDGSFFITDDERILMFGAGSGSIQGYELDQDFTTFRTKEDGSDFVSPINAARMGGWNEGPFILYRYGKLYMTFTGTNYINRDYRVDYCYGDASKDPVLSSTYKRIGTTLLKTGDDFYGLGHSCTVLGPDLDSYYIAYHNMVPGRIRYLNFSRLSFDNSAMVANCVRPTDCVGTDLPSYYAESIDEFDLENNMYLFNGISEDAFTVEYNVVGEGKMVFSYKDKNNYNYINFENNEISVVSVINSKENIVASSSLINEFDTSVYHTFRLQYKDGNLVLYFDNMTKILTDNINFSGGKVGYFKNNNFEEIGYTAFTNVAFGSSDNLYYADTVSLASCYDTKLSYLGNDSEFKEESKSTTYNLKESNTLILKGKDNFVTYRMYAHENSNGYNINLRVPSEYLNKSFGIKIDGGELINVNTNSSSPKVDSGDVLLNVVTIPLEKGAHNITLYNTGDDIAFSRINYEENVVNEPLEIDFSKDSISNLIQRNNSLASITSSSNGLNSDSSSAYGVLTKEKYFNATVETEFTINSLDNSSAYIGLLLNINNYSIEEDDGNDDDTYNGYQFVLTKSQARINYCDFDFTDTVASAKFNIEEGNTYKLKVIQSNNNYKFYINDQLIIDYTANIGELSGQIGVFSHYTTSDIKTLKIE